MQKYYIYCHGASGARPMLDGVTYFVLDSRKVPPGYAQIDVTLEMPGKVVYRMALIV